MAVDEIMTAETRANRAQRIEEAIRAYFVACNAADAAAMIACFTPDAVHYFPAGSPSGPFVVPLRLHRDGSTALSVSGRRGQSTI